MQTFQKFSISEAINYAFRTYYRNFPFFLPIIIALACTYFLPIFPNENFLAIFAGIGMFIWGILLDVLVLKNYDNAGLIKFQNFFKYDINLGSFLLYSFFLFVINNIPNMIFGSTGYGNLQLAVLKILFNILCAILGITYLLGKYLILDRNLTFMQAFKAVPYLVYGAKIKLVLAWFVASLAAAVPLMILAFGCLYLGSGSIDKSYLQLASLPVLFGFWYPIIIMVTVSVYKQLIAHADDDLRKRLGDFQRDNENQDEFDDETL